MKTHQYLAKAVSTPLAIEKTRGRMILRALAASIDAERPAKDKFDEELPKMEIVDDVAIIPLWGAIDVNVPKWVKDWGCPVTDANDIEEEIDQALADPAVSVLAFTSDSPGGSAGASAKLFSLIEAAKKKKPAMGYIGDGALACSGAYYALAACNGIYCGPYADAIGNIGCWSAVVDDSEYWAQKGIKIEVFRSGEYKAIGVDALTEQHRAYLQKGVDDWGDQFRSDVKKYRTFINDDDMRGQCFSGREAAAHGFAAGLAKNLKAAISKFKSQL